MKKMQRRLTSWARTPRVNQEEEKEEILNEIEAYGDLIGPKLEGTVRIGYQNINGIKKSKDMIGVEELEAMREMNLDLVGLSETNYNWDPDARNLLHTAAGLRFNNTARCAMSSCRSKVEGYLPGGTATISQGKFSGRVMKRGSDSLGSFTWMAVRGKKDIGVIAITAYRVCQKAGAKSGPETAFTQQCIQMRADGDTSPDPRNEIFKNMSKVLEEWTLKGYHPLVMIDANSEITETKLQEFTQKYGLHDIITAGRDERAPPSYARGAKRIDFMLGDDHIQRAVVNSGALGLHDGISASDHTMQYIDLDEKLLFGDDSFTPIQGYHREFKLYDIKRKNDFTETLLEAYEHQRIGEKVDELADRLERKGYASKNDIIEYNKLDTEIVELIKMAASKVGRIDFGYQRSKDLCEAGQTIRLHKTILSCVRNKLNYTEKLKKLANELEYELPTETISLREALTNLCEAWKAKGVIEREDGVRRAKWLEQLASAKVEETGGDPEKSYANMIKAALSKGMFKRFKSILQAEWSSLDYIEVPNEKWYLDKDKNELYEFDNGIFVAHSQFEDDLYEEYGSIKVLPKKAVVVDVDISEDIIHVKNPESITEQTWTKVSNPEEMESWLMRRNKRHLQQMYIEGSPPTTKEFESILEEHGTSEIADQILDGTFDYDSIDMGEEMKLFLKSLKRTPEEQRLKVPSRMPKEAFQKVMKVQQENTTSSPSGLHYTLWKAIAEVDELAEIHALWLSLPFMYGFICDRHKREIDCMLEKKPGVRQIHIMRIIGLMEGDWNAYLKWAFNKHIMPNAEHSGLSSNQWGGRRGRSAIACALRKMITWEYFRYVKETILSFPGDLQSNFDRMLPSLNSIIAMKFGMSRTAAKCRAATVEAFERPIRTAAGTSESMYKHETGETKMGGEIQGKPDNMQLWAMESSLLLDIHQNQCRGAVMEDPAGNLRSRRTNDGYVDDTDTLACAPITNTIEEGVENIQNDSQFWATLISLVGQALAFHKCFWQALSWMAVGGYYMIQTRDKFRQLEVWIRDHRGKASKIDYRHHDEPNDGLGLRLCPTGNQKPEFKKRLDQATKFASKVKTSRFKVGEAWIALKVCVLPAISYPLALTRFTAIQLGKLDTVLNDAFLPKLNINRKMSRTVLTAPIELGGIAYPNMETLQDQLGITNVMRQLQLGKEISTDLRILVAQAQLESGLTAPILDDTSVKVNYIEPGLIMHLHDRLQSLDGSIVIEGAWCPSTQRGHDQSIMEALSKLEGVKTRDLQHANQCRKYIRVITLAEMTSLCGKYVEPNRFNARWRAKSKLRWARQPPPTGPMWDTFRRLFKRAFCTKNKTRRLDQRLPLDRPLGAWYNVERHIEYDVYRSKNVICERQTVEGPSIYDRYITKDDANYFVKEGTRHDLVHASHPTSLTEGREGHFHADHEYNMELTPIAIANTEEEEQIQATELDILLSSDELVACSDGSYDPIEQKAAFNWRIVTPNETGLTTGSAPVNTNPKYLNSYRAEFAGLRGVIKYMRKHGMKDKKITVYCDGQSCVNALNADQEFTSSSLERAESDIIQTTQKIMKDFSNLTIEWVEGHQDDNDDVQMADRPLPVRLNIQCDLAAKECLKNSIKPTTRAAPFEGAGATLYLGQHMVTTEMKEQIHYAAHAPKMLQHVQDHLKRTKETVEEINWRAIGRAKKRLKLHESIRTSKMMYGWLNVGTQKRHLGQISTCPCCGIEEETHHHLYLCSNESMRDTLKESIALAKSKLVKDRIPSNVYNGFIEQICLATNTEHPDARFQLDDRRVQDVMDQQSKLGELALLKGFVHKEWTRILNEHWTPAPPRPDGKKNHQKDSLEQTVSLIRVLWDIFETQWKCRNDILHGDESRVSELDTNRKTDRLLKFIEHKRTMLRRCDHSMVDHPIADVIKWSRNHKIKVLQNLERLKKIYDKELKAETSRLRPITNFFLPVR